jgi:hypothetical protein
MQEAKFQAQETNMLTKFVVAFSILALVAAFAGNIPAVAHITLNEPSSIGGTVLQAGDYRLLISDTKVTFGIDKRSFDVPAKLETVAKKFDTTEIRCATNTTPPVVESISLGGTKVRLLFK